MFADLMYKYLLMCYSLFCVKVMDYEKREPANQCKFAFYKLWMEMNRNKMGDGKQCLKHARRMSIELKNGEEIIVYLILKCSNTRTRLIKMRNNHKIIDIIHAKMYIIRTEVQ